MALLIDPPAWHAHGRRWSHLVSDTSLEELHAFAQGLGIPPRGFEGDHYDIPEERYAAAVTAGALPTDPRTLLVSLQRSGLRMPKRKGDKGVARARAVQLASGTVADVDLFASSRAFDERRVFAAMVFLRDRSGDFVVVHSIRRNEWGSPGGWREPGESVSHNAIREVREETGLALAPAQLQVWGHERFRHVSGPGVAPDGRSVLQVFTATLSTTRPPLSTTFDDTSGRRWVTAQEYAELCSDQFWWPLAERFYD